ncbi:alpha/beta hydrolase [Clostridium malenominatum]|uniref:Alpha/beta hydrolase n=1 Tax=Clostridium malenominatum TaxID=1539 RepID=A0ABN1J5E9_9CLOT
MYIEESGNPQGDIILFIHGGGVGGWMWDNQVKYFKDYYCLVPDLPSHGKSKCELKFNIRECADELIRLIEKKKDGRKIFLIGFSIGAQIAIDLISKKPDIIDRAILISPLARPMKYTKKIIRSTIPLVIGLIKNKSFQKFQSKYLYISDDYFEEYFSGVHSITSEVLIKIYEENMSFSIPEAFSKATTKMLVLVGEKEQSVMIKSAKDLETCNKNVEVIKIPKVGHGYSLLRPEEFNKLSDEWLSDKRRKYE